MGLVIAELQTSDEFRTQIQWLANESAKLNFLFAGRSMAHVDTWFSNHLLRDIATINDLKREFVHVTRAAWPRALIEAASEESQSPSSRLATAQILEPRNNETEPLEITAQWPFEVRVRCLVDNVKDITTIYVKVHSTYYVSPMIMCADRKRRGLLLVECSTERTDSLPSGPTG